jgi:hypothetical protein
MTKRVGGLLAVGTIAAVMLVFIVTLILNVPFQLHSSVEWERAEVDAAEQPPFNFGLSSNNYLFDAGPAWFLDGIIRIIPTLGVNFDFLRPYASADGVIRSTKVSIVEETFDGEPGFAAKHRHSYETGIRICLSPTLDVGATHGKRYEGNRVATSLETGFGL